MTYAQAVTLFKKGRITEQQLEKVYQAHHAELKKKYEENCIDVVFKK